MKEVYISVDIEADGLVAGIHSMVALGAVVVEKGLNRTFYSTMRPISDVYLPDSLAVTGFTREQTLLFPSPELVIPSFVKWIKGISYNPVCVGDNPTYDFSFINWYTHTYSNGNPFGHKGRSITDLYKGLKGDIKAKSSHLKRTTHDHNALNDAMGNAEVFLAIAEKLGILL